MVTNNKNKMLIICSLTAIALTPMMGANADSSISYDNMQIKAVEGDTNPKTAIVGIAQTSGGVTPDDSDNGNEYQSEPEVRDAGVLRFTLGNENGDGSYNSSGLPDCDLGTSMVVFGGVTEGTTITAPNGDVHDLYEGAQYLEQLGQWEVNGQFTHMVGMTASDVNCMTSIDEWANTATTSTRGLFQGNTSLSYIEEIPSTIENMENMFSNQTSFDMDISDWNVSNVSNMRLMFANNNAFNNGGEPLVWDVNRVTDMYAMFYGASRFNQDISTWDVCNVTEYVEFDGNTSDDWTSDMKPVFGNC